MQPDEKTQKTAEAISQTIESQDNTVQLDTSSVTEAPAPEQSQSSTPPETKTDEPKQIPDKATTTKATANVKVIILVAGASLLLIIGLLLAVFSFVTLGIILVIAAAMLVLLAVFLPIR